MTFLRNTTVHIEKTTWHIAFSVSLEDCFLMMANPDSLREVHMKRKQQGCTAPICYSFLGLSLPIYDLDYLTCIDEWMI
jgi:hypothetical protein